MWRRTGWVPLNSGFNGLAGAPGCWARLGRPAAGGAPRLATVSTEPAVDITGLVKNYGRTAAVAGLSLRAERGQVTAILGPNGAGKTTTVEICEGYRRPDAGTVRVLGLDPVRDGRELRPRVGVMLQVGGIPTSARAGEYLRVTARFYAHPMDPAGLREAGAAVILTTHHMEEAERLADRVAILDHGALVADGTPAELTGTAGQLRFRAEPGLDTDNLLAALPPGSAAKESPAGHYVVEVHDRVDPQLLAAVTAWCAERGILAQSLRIESRTLEDVFLELTGRELRS